MEIFEVKDREKVSIGPTTKSHLKIVRFGGFTEYSNRGFWTVLKFCEKKAGFWAQLQYTIWTLTQHYG